jgi:hypothetical protein
MLRWVWKLQNIKCWIVCQSELNNNDYVGECFVIFHLRAEFVWSDDRFYDSSIDLTYGANYNDMSWNLNLGYKTKSITGMDYRKILAQL